MRGKSASECSKPLTAFEVVLMGRTGEGAVSFINVPLASVRGCNGSDRSSNRCRQCAWMDREYGSAPGAGLR